MTRRDAVSLICGGVGSLLGSCVASPSATPSTALPTTAMAALPTATVASGTPRPTQAPTRLPTAAPTAQPTAAPTPVPTAKPTLAPTLEPTLAPTLEPTAVTPPALAAEVDAAMQRAIQGNALPGGVVLVLHKGVPLLLKAYGLSHKYDSPTVLTPEPIAARTDTLYDFASITKLFTVTCVMRLVEQGRLALDEPVAHWLPEFAAGGKDEVMLRHLLTHTSGLPDLLQLWNLEHTPAARLQRVLRTPLLNPPGTVLRYSDVGLIAVGYLLEQVAGSGLDSVVADLVTRPLGLKQVMFRPPADLRPRIAATEDEPSVGRGLVWGEVDDANAWSLGGIAGHAGLFGTAEELGSLAQLSLDGGTIDGSRLLQSATVAEMTHNQIGKLGWRGLGWELNATYYMAHLASPQTYGHTGFTGTSVVIDPRRQLIVVLLTNRVHPTPDGPSINPTRQAIADAALAAADAA